MSIIVGENSYITIVEAQEYLDNEFNTDSWDDASDSNKEKALKQATKKIDKQYLLFSKYDDSQVLQFPRSVTISFNYNDVDGVVNSRIKEAQALEALNILDTVTGSNGLQTASNDAIKGIVSRGVKSANVSYDKDQAERLRRLSTDISDRAKELIRPWIQTTFDRC